MADASILQSFPMVVSRMLAIGSDHVSFTNRCISMNICIRHNGRIFTDPYIYVYIG